jgi:copper homeostasis protein
VKITLEVAIETIDDAEAATQGGADRLELCSALDLGGLTPTVSMWTGVQSLSTLPVVVMIRPRGGDFVYDDREVEVMLREIKHFRHLRPAGFVLGVLNESGRIHEAACEKLIAAANNTPVVFHRAFDRTPEPEAALETCIELGFARILTSGRETTGLAGSPAIAMLQTLAAGRIEILPCGRVDAASAPEILRLSKCQQIHGSFAEPLPEATHRGRRGYAERCRTSAANVAAVRKVIDQDLSSSS